MGKPFSSSMVSISVAVLDRQSSSVTVSATSSGLTSASSDYSRRGQGGGPTNTTSPTPPSHASLPTVRGRTASAARSGPTPFARSTVLGNGEGDSQVGPYDIVRPPPTQEHVGAVQFTGYCDADTKERVRDEPIAPATQVKSSSRSDDCFHCHRTGPDIPRILRNSRQNRGKRKKPLTRDIEVLRSGMPSRFPVSETHETRRRRVRGGEASEHDDAKREPSEHGWVSRPVRTRGVAPPGDGQPGRPEASRERHSTLHTRSQHSERQIRAGSQASGRTRGGGPNSGVHAVGRRRCGRTTG